MGKAIWIDASRAPDSGARKKLILSALEHGFGHIVVSGEDRQSNRYGRFHMIIADKDRFILGRKMIARSIKIEGKQDERRHRSSRRAQILSSSKPRTGASSLSRI